MMPDQIAKSGSESSEQQALFCWAALAAIDYPPLCYLFAIPNGGFRFKREAARLKAEGVRAGVPDVLLPLPKFKWAGLFIEMKKKRVGRVQDNQSEWIVYLNSVGYLAVVCYGWEDARDTILTYLRY